MREPVKSDDPAELLEFEDSEAGGTAQVDEPASNSPLRLKAHVGTNSDIDLSESTTEPHGATFVTPGRANNDNVSLSPSSMRSLDTTPVPVVRNPSGSNSVQLRNNEAPVVRRAVQLPDIGVNQAVLISLADLLQGVSDPDGDVLGIGNIVSSSGRIVATGDGSWTFTPGSWRHGRGGAVI